MFYRAIIIEPDKFQSEIIDEQDFNTREEAENFCQDIDDKQYVTAIAKIA